jgi:hypothetical protein
MEKKKPASDAGKTPYRPTVPEQTALDNIRRRRAAQTTPRLKVVNNGAVATITPDHPDQAVGFLLLREALGSVGCDFADVLIRQLAQAASPSKEIDEAKLNFMLSVVKDAKPKDQFEAMLAAQMAAVHMATMTFAQRLARVENIPQQDSAWRAFNQFARTFAMQMEALKRYRTGGEQKVTVQHVSVSQGGQAIVGNVTQGARESAPAKPSNLTPALSDARQAPMTILGEPERVPVELRRRQGDDSGS